ncbi:MAG: hypothetical protein PHI35_00580 [Victivallaceae bacterium]|nr:hypothetical protein [Victivallaceae bacterium]
MKVLNVILSILILLLAITSAVFAYLLFEKRAEMLDGWNKLASAINLAATAVDAESGSKYGPKLTAVELSHKNYTELAGKLTELEKMTAQLVKERNDLSDALFRIGSEMGFSREAVSVDSLRKFESYSGAIAAVANGVSDINNAHKTAARQVAQAFGTLGIQVNASALLANDGQAVGTLTSDVNALANRISDYREAIKFMAKEGNVDYLNFGYNDQNYRGAISQAKQAVTGIRTRNDELDSAVRTANGEIRNLKDTVSVRDTKITELSQVLTEQARQIGEIKKVLKLDPEADLPTPWVTGSLDARRKIAGSVIKVDKPYGYIGLDIGKSTRVMQQLSPAKAVEIDPGVTEGLSFKVYRGEIGSGDAPEFIATVKLVKVDDDCSVANIPEGAKIKAGDRIVFEPENK